MKKFKSGCFLIFLAICGCTAGRKDKASTPPLPVQLWTTSGDGTQLLQPTTLAFAQGPDDRLPTIRIDAEKRFQTIEGFGYTLTGGSAALLHRMGKTERAALLQEFFGKNANSIGVSYLRLSIGASDLDAGVFSYDDLPAGQTDPELRHFNLSQDTLHLIPVLQEILAINPAIKFMGSPWSAPLWMKTNGSSKGGELKPEFYAAYAQYFVKYIRAMQALGIRIDAVTPQNEPQHGGNNPSLVMSALQQADFIKNHLGPAFRAAGIAAKIIIWDHNCDHPEYPLAILADPAAKAFVHGTAFHLYGGDVSALSQVHDAHPDQGLYFTEQWTSSEGQFGGDLNWHVKNVIIGTLRNWSRVALEWNLANDPTFGPHTPGGCTQCRGAVTIDGSRATKNVSYYIIAQASKFVPPGSVRIDSNLPAQLPNVAFRTPAGQTVVIVLNEGTEMKAFQVGVGGKWIGVTLAAGAVGTVMW